MSALGIYNIGREYFKRGGEGLIIDEAHRAADWAAEIKSLIDTYPKKSIWISGSSQSALRKGNADLSRRVLWYDLPGLSFREYLHLTGQGDIAVITLDDLIAHHSTIARDLAAKGNLLNAFRNYLKYGHYPFFMQGLDLSFPRLSGTWPFVTNNCRCWNWDQISPQTRKSLSGKYKFAGRHHCTPSS